VPDEFEREIVAQDLLEGVSRFLAASGAAVGRLGFDDAHLTVKQCERVRELLPAAWELVPCAGAVERLRAVKDAGELARIREAAALVDEILQWIVERGLVGRTEREVAIELEHE